MINVIAEGRKECLYTPTPGFHLRGLSELCLQFFSEQEMEKRMRRASKAVWYITVNLFPF